MEKRYPDEISMICHQAAEALYKIGAITEAEMSEYNADCLVHESEPVEVEEAAVSC